MAYKLTGRLVVGQTDEVHSSQKNAIGTIARDTEGGEWIYMQGVASCVDGTWVTFDEDHVPTRAVADGQGQVAVAKAAIDATTEFGWYCIKSPTGGLTALCLASFADNGKVYLTSTAGSVDDADVAGDAVVGAWGRGARDATTGMAVFQLAYPQVSDLAVD